jgi:proline iminopeptidase
LRAVTTGTSEEIENIYHHGEKFFPEEYEGILDALPDPTRRPLVDYLYELLQTEDRETVLPVMDAKGLYVAKTAMMGMTDEILERLRKLFPDDDLVDKRDISLHYETNRYFLEEGQLLRDVDRVRDIPVIIVNGRYDLICPPIYAYRLHKKLPKSELVLVNHAGHWDEALVEPLVSAIRRLE